MEADYVSTEKSNNQILQELEAISKTLYQSHTTKTTRRTASLALPRTSPPPIITDADKDHEPVLNAKTRSRRRSLSPWWSKPKAGTEDQEQLKKLPNKPLSPPPLSHKNNKWADENPSSEKKGIWNWKPIRALSHIGKQKLSCLFSVEVVTIQGLPATMNGLRLAVCVRKKETRDGAVQTMPSRVSQGVADFEETLFVRCNVYFTPGSGTSMKFEPRPFLIHALAVDAEELNFGKNSVDLSGLIQESIEKSFEGTRIRQWDTSFNLYGKAKGGELVLKLGFQIMEKDGGIGIYSRPEGQTSNYRSYHSPSFARRQSKTSFSIQSPRITGRTEAWPQQRGGASSDRFEGIDVFKLDEPDYGKLVEGQHDDDNLPDFDIVEKGVEIQEEQLSEENSDKRSASSEVVKEIVQEQSHLIRLAELDSIAQQIKALESVIGDKKQSKVDDETASQMLDADEDKVTREFFQMLEHAEEKLKNQIPRNKHEKDRKSEAVYLPDLGKGLGCIVQTRNGGYLAAMNPLDKSVQRKETPRLAMQMSKPLVIKSNEMGFEVLQKMATMGLQELTSETSSLMPLDELVGKTAEQIAFEGIASAIIQGRNREGKPSSTAARTIAAIKTMMSAMNKGRKERLSTGIWSVSEEPLPVDEILAISMQKIESMAFNALKLQAGVAEEDAPFDVSPVHDAEKANLLASAAQIEDFIKESSSKSSRNIILALVVQLRDPGRQFEAVGGPMIALIHATCEPRDGCDEGKTYKLASLQVCGVKVRTPSETKNVWDSEKQRLTALQWLMGNGVVKGGKRDRKVFVKGPDLLWSISSRTLGDMWLKPIRNPDVKFSK